jgi:hypothetical protein
MTKEWVPTKEIEIVLRREFVAPFIDSIRHDPAISLKLSNAFVLLALSEKQVVEFDKEQAEAREEIDATKEKTLFLGYLGKIFQSALLLIGSTDYLGAIILMRSIFELLIGMATSTNGSMRDRISSIGILDSKEQSDLQKLWNDLSAWAHPYGKWAKNVCPKFYGIGRNYHPMLFRQCVDYSDQILDFLLTITVDHFKLSPETYLKKYREICETTQITEISNLQMFEKRLNRTKSP